MRQKKRDGHRHKERKFISPRMMRVIRWDVAVANRHIKARGDADKEYVSLHAWGCGCCFLTPVKKLKRSWFVSPVAVGVYNLQVASLRPEDVRKFRGPYETERIAKDVANRWYAEEPRDLWIVRVENGQFSTAKHEPTKVWYGVLGNKRDPSRVRP